MQTAEDTIAYRIKDCTVHLFVGIYDYEKAAPQTVVINLEVLAPLTRRYDNVQENTVASVIDYAPVLRYITEELPKLGHIPLLESIGEKIIDCCCRDARVTEVNVRLEKPDLYKGKAVAGIEMRRKRAGTQT